MRLFFSATCLLLLLLPAMSGAISKYIDENGRTVYVDDESKIPARYLEQSQNVEGLIELSAEERNAQRERLQKARDQRRQDLNDKRRKSAEQERKKLYQTPVIINGPQILVPVEVAYGNRKVKVNLLLDTGASRTVLHRKSISRLDIDADEGMVAYGVGVGGYRIKTRMVKFRSIKVGPFKADGASAFIIEHRNNKSLHDGLLGMDFLRYLSYDIDYATQTIQWQP